MRRLLERAVKTSKTIEPSFDVHLAEVTTTGWMGATMSKPVDRIVMDALIKSGDVWRRLKAFERVPYVE